MCAHSLLRLRFDLLRLQIDSRSRTKEIVARVGLLQWLDLTGPVPMRIFGPAEAGPDSRARQDDSDMIAVRRQAVETRQERQ